MSYRREFKCDCYVIVNNNKEETNISIKNKKIKSKKVAHAKFQIKRSGYTLDIELLYMTFVQKKKKDVIRHFYCNH